MKFTESQLEQAFISLLEAQGYPYVPREEIIWNDFGMISERIRFNCWTYRI